MKPADDELIAHIKEHLTEYEEAYVPGAWERFEKKERKKGWVFWLGSLSTAAAVLLVGFVFFYTANKVPEANPAIQTTINNGQVEKMPVPAVSHQDTAVSSIAIKRLTEPVVENAAVVAQRINNGVANSPIVVAVQKPLVVQEKVVAGTATPVAPAITELVVVEKKEPGAKTTAAEVIAKTPVKEDKITSFQEFLNAEVKSNANQAIAKGVPKKVDKWEMGLVVAPSIGNSKKLNMGYGVTMAYALSDKVSVSSGLSYSEMGATKSMVPSGAFNTPNSPGPAASIVATETKSLQSVDANLVGLDIPLEIKYYITKRFYTNVGISAFAVLNQKQNNNYLRGAVESAPETQDNISGFKTVFQTRAVSEPVPAEEIRSDKYLGFYNISFGYKQKISEKKAFSIEPFMKLPVKEFSKENLHLIGTGVRLKLDF